MKNTRGAGRIADRKQREKEDRRKLILAAARRIAEEEGWASVTVRRLAEEIAYSQPVLYAHFSSREGVVDAVAVEGFRELGEALEGARMRHKRPSGLQAVAEAYLAFAAASPALYEAMFRLRLGVPFDDPATPPELHFAFAQLAALFEGQNARPELGAELFWASLHGIAELTRTQRFPPSRQRQRVRMLTQLFQREDSEDRGSA